MNKCLKKLLFLCGALATLGNIAQANNQAMPIYKPAPITQKEMTLLRSEPLSLLAKFPEEGPEMAQYVARAIVSDPSLVDPILSIAGDTSPEQASAIGAGIARGARIVGLKRPRTARVIADKVMMSENLRLKITFQAIGPSYIENLDSKTPDPILPAPLSSNEVGTSMPNYKSKIGPEKQEDLIIMPEEEVHENDPMRATSGRILFSNILLTNIINSDASHSGAVSTSPTQ